MPSPFLEHINQQLAARGVAYRVMTAEYVTTAVGPEFGQILLAANHGNKQLDDHFVPGDPRRGGRTNITFTADQIDAAANGATPAETNAAVISAMATWEGARCSAIELDPVGSGGVDVGAIETLIPGEGGSLTVIPADVIHAGWISRTLFDLLDTDGGDFILGVTFTFGFTPGGGVNNVPPFTDINADGKGDVAFREIYYNNAIDWQVGAASTTGAFDPETVIVHEAGHSLSQAHFGRFSFNTSRGILQFSPDAVMNAAVFGLQRTLEGTDNAGHCSIWAQWPN